MRSLSALVIASLLLLLPLGGCRKDVRVFLSVKIDGQSDPVAEASSEATRGAGDGVGASPAGDVVEGAADAAVETDPAEKPGGAQSPIELAAGSGIIYTWRVDAPRPHWDAVKVLCMLPDAGLLQPVEPGAEPYPCDVSMEYGPYGVSCVFGIPRSCDDGILRTKVEIWRLDREEPVLSETHHFRIQRDNMIRGARTLARDASDPNAPPWAYFQRFTNRRVWTWAQDVRAMAADVAERAPELSLIGECPISEPESEEPPPERTESTPRKLNCWLGEGGIAVPYVKDVNAVSAPIEPKVKGKKPKTADKPPPPPPPAGIKCEIPEGAYGADLPASLMGKLGSATGRMLRLEWAFDEDLYRRFFDTFLERKSGVCRYVEVLGGLRDAPIPRDLSEYDALTFVVRSTTSRPVRFGVNLDYELVNYKTRPHKKLKGKTECLRRVDKKSGRMVILEGSSAWKRFELDLRRDLDLGDEDLERTTQFNLDITSVMDFGDLFEAIENPLTGELQVAELAFIGKTDADLARFRLEQRERHTEQSLRLEEMGCPVDEEGIPIGPKGAPGKKGKGGKRGKGGGGAKKPLSL